MLKSLYQYREFLKTNVKKDIRGKYKGSFLGILWSFINPLLMALVYAIVFPFMDQNSYIERYNSYVSRYETLTASLAELEAKKTDRLTQAKNIEGFMSELSQREELLDVFDDRLWLVALDCAVAHSDGRLVFKFYGGMEVEG